jgi:hypothetical protein
VNDKLAHSIVFRFNTFDPFAIHLLPDGKGLIFQALRHVWAPRALSDPLRWHGDGLLQFLVKDVVCEAQFMGAFD